MKQRRKKRRRERKKDWLEHGDDAFTHDLKRHRRTDSYLPDTEPGLTFDESIEANAVVVSHTKKWATVEWKGEEVLCRIDESLNGGHATLLAPGDRVRVELREGDPWIVGVRPRDTRLSRLAIHGSRVSEQVMAANLDVLVIVVTPVKPRFKPGIVDRFLIIAETGGVAPVVCMNKMDLVDEAPEALGVYETLDVPVVKTSCQTGQGIDALRGHLSNKTGVFAGQSGVGKTSLLNALDPALELPTREVSRSTEKGRHTTTAARLFHLAGGIDVIDTPGLRKLGLWKVTDAHLSYYFPEMAELAPQCKFRDCSHTHEPECAVREAVHSGEISEQRYRSYRRIREGLQEQAEREGY